MPGALASAWAVRCVPASGTGVRSPRPLRKPWSLFLPPCRHGRFKRSNSVTAAVQADLELEGFPGRVATEDKGLQFGPSFQRHSEPSTPTQGGAVRTVRTQGLFSYREDYRPAADAASLPAPEPWLGPPLDSPDSSRVSPCRRDGPWFLELLRAETARMESWCKDMEREAEDHDLAEDGEARGRPGLRRVPPTPEGPGPHGAGTVPGLGLQAPAPCTWRQVVWASGPLPRTGAAPRLWAIALALCQGGVTGEYTVLPVSWVAPGHVGTCVALARALHVSGVSSLCAEGQVPTLIPAASAHLQTPSSAFTSCLV